MSDSPATPFLDVKVKGVTTKVDLDALCRVGRSDANDIVLDDQLASRNHAILYRSENGEYFINDLGSSNSTFVNSRRLSAPTILREGDVIAIGGCQMVFHQVGALQPPAPKMDLGSTSILITRTLISVLVADIRGFTTMAQRVDAETLSQITGALFRESGQILQQRGAWAQKYIGDAVMAVWQHTRKPGARDIVEILGAAATINEIAAGLQKRFSLAEPVRIGIGLNTGYASLGNIGSVASSDHTAVGDTVNKAFRLESATREVGCDVLIGPSTQELIADLPGLTDGFQPYSLKLKGYADPVEAFGTQHATLAAALVDGANTTLTS